MKTSSRARDIGVPYIGSRSGHVSQISLNETSHHVTEAIGDLYGNENYLKHETHLLSSSKPPRIKVVEPEEQIFDPRTFSWARTPDDKNGNNSIHFKSPIMSDTVKRSSLEAKNLPNSLSLRDGSSNTQFPLTEMSYETDPAEFAQALSDLQALRRMSIDVGNTSDPDLPSFQSLPLMPSIAPTSGDSDNDPSRLFWVPARVHPELAPMEFKTFLENRVQSIKRQAGDQMSTSLDRPEQKGSLNGSLSRKKSMLSRQIDNINNLETSDTLNQLEGKSSSSSQKVKSVDLKELNDLVRNRSEAMRKLTLEAKSNGLGFEDAPILPRAPGIGLRRSTRTTYRRGSLRKGERIPHSKRVDPLRKDETISRSSEPRIEDQNQVFLFDQPKTENFSHPIRRAPQLQDQLQLSKDITFASQVNSEELCNQEESKDFSKENDSTSNLESRSKLPRRSTISTQVSRPYHPLRSRTSPSDQNYVPQTKETPPNPEQSTEKTMTQQPSMFPGRSSSQVQLQLQLQKKPAISDINVYPTKNSTPPILPTHQSSTISRQNIKGTSQNPPSQIMNNIRTDTHIFTPTTEAKKSEKKLKKEKDESENNVSRKTTWNWFKVGDEKEKKDKKKDDEREMKKNKKLPTEKIHDNARLDVLQSTLENGVSFGRETMIINCDNLDHKSQDEKKKDPRKPSGEKKEKDSIFSSIFGGGKKKGDRDSSAKKGTSLGPLSPQPLRFLQPDVDYNWTRFSILDERAIYRMAHIKLANPRRALYSQVLLSNFMYSYLAKVQQMHPHLQVPQSALQKKQEMERRQKEQDQQAIQHLQETDQYRYDYHEGITRYVENAQQNDYKSEGVNYVDDSQIYDFDHQQDNNSFYGQSPIRPESRTSQHTTDNAFESEIKYERQGNEYYRVAHPQDTRDENEMW